MNITNEKRWAWLLPADDGTSGKGDDRMAGWLYLRPVSFLTGMQAFAAQVNGARSKFLQSSAEVCQVCAEAHLSHTDSATLAHAVALHDSIMLYAQAATKVLSEAGDLYDGSAMMRAMLSTTFMGMGGTAVTLDKNGDRIDSYETMNYVLGADNKITSIRVGAYDSTDQQYRASQQDVLWPGGTTTVPASFYGFIVLGALLANTGPWAAARTIAGALPLAVDAVNNDPNLLPRHTLEFQWRDSGCNAAQALQSLGSLTSSSAIDAVIGPACSVGCEPTAFLAAGRNRLGCD